MLDLPPELLEAVFSFLDIRQLYVLDRVCKALRLQLTRFIHRAVKPFESLSLPTRPATGQASSSIRSHPFLAALPAFRPDWEAALFPPSYPFQSSLSTGLVPLEKTDFAQHHAFSPPLVKLALSWSNSSYAVSYVLEEPHGIRVKDVYKTVGKLYHQGAASSGSAYAIHLEAEHDAAYVGDVERAEHTHLGFAGLAEPFLTTDEEHGHLHVTGLQPFCDCLRSDKEKQTWEERVETIRMKEQRLQQQEKYSRHNRLNFFALELARLTSDTDSLFAPGLHDFLSFPTVASMFDDVDLAFHPSFQNDESTSTHSDEDGISSRSNGNQAWYKLLPQIKAEINDFSRCLHRNCIKLILIANGQTIPPNLSKGADAAGYGSEFIRPPSSWVFCGVCNRFGTATQVLAHFHRRHLAKSTLLSRQSHPAPSIEALAEQRCSNSFELPAAVVQDFKIILQNIDIDPTSPQITARDIDKKFEEVCFFVDELLGVHEEVEQSMSWLEHLIEIRTGRSTTSASTVSLLPRRGLNSRPDLDQLAGTSKTGEP
ncbi:hypothetical protein JCM11251_000141 [Rhodosporidiobolus azoricus]